LSAELTSALNRADIVAYERLLAEDLQVFDGARLVASSRDKWMEEIKSRVGPRTRIQPIGTVLDGETFYAMDQLTTPRPGWWGRVIKYEVKDKRITTIRFFTGYGGGLPLLKPDTKQLEPAFSR
jgi:hypothetical protein